MGEYDVARGLAVKRKLSEYDDGGEEVKWDALKKLLFP